MRRRLSRTQLRRQRAYREAVVNQPAMRLPHDPVALMAVIDVMPRRLRDEINERGIEQDILDRLPGRWAQPIAMALNLDDSDDAIANVWDD